MALLTVKGLIMLRIRTSNSALVVIVASEFVYPSFYLFILRFSPFLFLSFSFFVLFLFPSSFPFFSLSFLTYT